MLPSPLRLVPTPIPRLHAGALGRRVLPEADPLGGVLRPAQAARGPPPPSPGVAPNRAPPLALLPRGGREGRVPAGRCAREGGAVRAAGVLRGNGLLAAHAHAPQRLRPRCEQL
eukprot:2229036-Pyramimonas_sp.AAC.2